MKKTIVIKYGGSLMDDKSAEKKILKNIKTFALKNPVIVVHGGGKEITAALKKAKIETLFVDGLRYTDEKAIKIVEKVLEKIQTGIAKKLKNASAVKKAVVGCRLKKLGYVGRFSSVKCAAIKNAINAGKIAVISPVGKSASGQVLNLNADEAASGIAIRFGAEKLIFFTDVKGVLDKNGKTIPQIMARGMENLISRKIITGGMIPKIRNCALAVKKGVSEVDIFDAGMKGTKII